MSALKVNRRFLYTIFSIIVPITLLYHLVDKIKVPNQEPVEIRFDIKSVSNDTHQMLFDIDYFLVHQCWQRWMHQKAYVCLKKTDQKTWYGLLFFDKRFTLVSSCEVVIKGRCEENGFHTNLEQSYLDLRYTETIQELLSKNKGQVVGWVDENGEVMASTLWLGKQIYYEILPQDLSFLSPEKK